MDCCFGYIDDTTRKKNKSWLQTIEELKGARSKLTPIVDNVIKSALSSKSTYDYSFGDHFELSPQQYHDIVWASEILRDYQLKSNDHNYTLPNANVIVQNVSVHGQSKTTVKDKTVIVDEVLLLELLKLYEHMGLVIQKLTANCVQTHQSNLYSTNKLPETTEDVEAPNETDKHSTCSDFKPSSMSSKEHYQKKTIEDAKTTKEPDQDSTYHDVKHQITGGSLHSIGGSPRTSVTSKQSSKIPEIRNHDEENSHDVDAFRRSSIRSKQSSKLTAFKLDEEENVYASPRGSIRSKQNDKIAEESDDDDNLFSKTAEQELHSPKLPKVKSTLSVLLDSSTSDHDKKPSKPAVKTEDEEDDGPSIFIKIKCCSRPCSSQEEVEDMVINCAENCTSNYHIKVNGKPVTLKVNQNNVEDGNVYCINTGVDSDDDGQIRIVIRQCPECKSTVIGSSTGIEDVMGESHESITLHGKQGDETKMVFSSDDDSEKTPSKMSIQKETPSEEKLRKDSANSSAKMSIHSETPNENESSEDSVESLEKTSTKTDTQSEKESRKDSINSSPKTSLKSVVLSDGQSKKSSIKSQPKMDVLIDTDNVENSTVEVYEDEPLLPLIRRRICSSMEFDVTTAQTRLREHEIEHENAKIVLELRNLGVDNILRACRPARCCRKAVLDEKQKTALPYCVSLRSLPLMGNDIEVIQQSIEMSKKRNKNAPDISQGHQETFAYYISLGKNEFKPDNNIPWVASVYDTKRNQNKLDVTTDKMFVLRKPVFFPKQVHSANKLIKVRKKNGKSFKRSSLSKLYISRKKVSSNISRTSSLKFKLYKYDQKRYHPKMASRLQGINSFNKKCFMKTCHAEQTIYEKNIYEAASNKDWNILFSKEYKQLDFDRKNSRIRKLPLPKNNVSKIFVVNEKLSKLDNGIESHNSKNMCKATLKRSDQKSLEGGDFSTSRFKMLGNYKYDICKRSANVVSNIYVASLKNKKNAPSKRTHKEKKVVRVKSMPFLWKQVSETWFSGRMKSPQRTNKRGEREKHKLFKNNKRSKDHRREKTCFVRASSACERIPKKYVPYKMSKSNNDINNPIEAKSQHKNMKLCHQRKKNKTVSFQCNKEFTKLMNAQLEFYIDIINGDLVWGNTLPLKPINYNTYYYHLDQPGSPESTNTLTLPTGARIPVEDPMYAAVITPDTTSRNTLLVTPVIEAEPPVEEDKVTISEITPAHFRLLYKNSNETFASSRKTPPFFSPHLLGPESQNTSWAPLVASEDSLPKIQEVVVPKKVSELYATSDQTPTIEEKQSEQSVKSAKLTETVEEKKELEQRHYTPLTKTKDMEQPKQDKPEEKVQFVEDTNVQKPNKCLKKKVCIKNSCSECQFGACTTKKRDREDYMPATPKNKREKKNQEKNKIKDQNKDTIYINGQAIQPCSKEICELYKNKKVVPDNKQSSSKRKSSNCERQITIKPGDKVEIYISNPKASNKSKKTDKEEKNEKNQQ